MSERYVCIHGHFYQPPRENPWLEEILRQESAHPYHDWNERIDKESYAPNAFSRILNERGLISRIVNNYARISFNFGPTLLQWLEKAAPDTYQAILDADRLSAEFFGGHGSAMAQAYNHIILPLANRRDKRTQILWGIRDFEARFGRFPQGMWLPETAVDVESLELMAEAGIRFTVLAPRQAEAVRHPDRESWIDVRGERVDPSRVYRVPLPSGRSIAAFFYDGGLSRAVAFERLLSDGHTLARRLVDAGGGVRGPGSLNHIATDGETYGHHHRHGEMALSYALKIIQDTPDVRLTNYAEYLERHPPTWEARVLEDSSWSCVHGVERWRSDCGCSTGSNAEWRQGWRKPLREALDHLRDTLTPAFEEGCEGLLPDPWRSRDRYIEVVLNRNSQNVKEFLEGEAGRPLDQDETVQALKLLELQRNAMLMYTSCGWFFDDLGRIETLQVLRYAARAIQLHGVLFDDEIEEDFLRLLHRARSSVAGLGSGADLYRARIVPERMGLDRVGAHHAVSAIFRNGRNGAGSTHRIYCYSVKVDEHQRLTAGGVRFDLGRLRVTSVVTRSTERFSYGVLHMGDHHLVGGVRPFKELAAHRERVTSMVEAFEKGSNLDIIRMLDRDFDASTYSLNSLFRDEQERVVNRILQSSLEEAERTLGSLYESRMPLMRFLADLNITQPRPFRAAGEFVLNTRLERALAEDEPDPIQLESLFHEAKLTGLRVDRETLGIAAGAAVERLLTRVAEAPDDADRMIRVRRVMEFIRSLPFATDLWRAQNVYFRLLEDEYPIRVQRAEGGDGDARWWMREWEALGSALGVSLPAALPGVPAPTASD